ncbi:hypothetical protein L484_006517 [Morus notabilis]|uniref:Uncharacterized protein n=1 Tax=Morus notabilis TaxID=981085 RepID=W9R9E4_9ROSA|nr:hypothetical protein L484_006517 [Morus notabilis]
MGWGWGCERREEVRMVKLGVLTATIRIAVARATSGGFKYNSVVATGGSDKEGLWWVGSRRHWAWFVKGNDVIIEELDLEDCNALQN